MTIRTLVRAMIAACVIGLVAPSAMATSHCETLWNGIEHIHAGQEAINNNCTGNAHGPSYLETFKVYGGADTVSGEADVDDIEGGSGLDTLRGGAGDDFIKGHGDEDSIFGGWGSDTIEGGAGAYSLGDVIRGEETYDYIYGGDDRDLMRGDEGDDLLSDQCCGPDIHEKDTGCGSGGHDKIYVNDDNEEDYIYDPSGTDEFLKEYGDNRTTMECPSLFG